jgi:hypothetical protein
LNAAELLYLLKLKIMINQNDQDYSDIEKLDDLRKKGIITEEEFAQKKASILGIQNLTPEKPIEHKIKPLPPKKGMGCLTIGLIVAGSVFGLILIITFIGILGSNSSTTNADERGGKSLSVKNDLNSKSEKIKAIDQVITAVQKDKDTYKDANWQMYLIMFQGFGEVIKKYENDPDPDIKGKVAELKKAVGKYQSKLLPKMRKSYSTAAGEKVWRSNLEVEVLGGNNSTIQLTGGILANNGNKEDMMKAMSEMVNKLRFKKVNMKWYQYDDEFTYYELETPKDTEPYN